MARAGRTFFFASLWLERRVRRDAAVLYCFCRAVDDLADGSPAGPARSAVFESILQDLETGRATGGLTGGAVDLIHRYPQMKEPLRELVRACRRDGPGIDLADEGELLEYARGVAGTVGLVMYPLLGGTDPAGRAHAEALGIAMQCTNIARDVIEDLKQRRVYLPRTWRNGEAIDGLLSGDAAAEACTLRAVRRLLQVAEEQYHFGLSGLSYLHPRCRRAIEIAARCYADIGTRIFEGQGLARQRAVVPLRRKVMIALTTLTTRPRSAHPEIVWSK